MFGTFPEFVSPLDLVRDPLGITRQQVRTAGFVAHELQRPTMQHNSAAPAPAPTAGASEGLTVNSYQIAKDAWDRAVDEELAAMGVKPRNAGSVHRAKAVCAVARRQPALRRQLLTAANYQK